MLTLFTTVGTYCCKDASHSLHLKKILNCIRTVDIEKIKTAVLLRTGENDIWDDLFDDNTEKLTAQFMRKVSESRT